jgi:hypothetical protein
MDMIVTMKTASGRTFTSERITTLGLDPGEGAAIVASGLPKDWVFSTSPTGGLRITGRSSFFGLSFDEVASVTVTYAPAPDLKDIVTPYPALTGVGGVEVTGVKPKPK